MEQSANRRVAKYVRPLKDKRITINRRTDSVDAAGYYVPGWQPVHPDKLWAYFRHVSGKEFFAAAAIQHTEEVVFAVNWRKDLTENAALTWAVEHRGQWHSIERIDTFEGYKQDIKLYCKSLATPAPDSIQPY